MAMDDLAGIYRIGDPKVVDRGVELIKEVRQLHDELCMKTRDLQLRSNDISKLLVQALTSCYETTKAAGILWPSLAQTTLDFLTKEVCNNASRSPSV